MNQTEVGVESYESFTEAVLTDPHGLCLPCGGPSGEAEELADTWKRLEVRIKRLLGRTLRPKDKKGSSWTLEKKCLLS